VKLEARGRIKELAGLHGVDQKVRAKILKTLELVERHPSHDELGELVQARLIGHFIHIGASLAGTVH